MTKISGNPAIKETFYTRTDGEIIECLDINGDFKHEFYCYNHGSRFIKGNCGRTICIDCKKEYYSYLNGCQSCKFYECEYGSRYEPGYELCELMYDNLKNWPFKNGCKHKVRK